MEARHQNQGCADRERRVQTDVESIDVVQRKKAEQHVRRSNLIGVRSQELEHVSDKVVVRQHYAFWQTSGAA